MTDHREDKTVEPHHAVNMGYAPQPYIPAEPAASGPRGITAVVLWPYDWTADPHNKDDDGKPEDPNTAAFSDTPGFIKKLQRTYGTNHVVVIGDGKTPLHLDDVARKLHTLKGPAFLYIAAHGSADAPTGQRNEDYRFLGIPVWPHMVDQPEGRHEISGIDYGTADSVVDGEEILKLNNTLSEDVNGGFITSAALFSNVPPTFFAVFQESCTSGAAVPAARRYLPPGTFYFPLSSANDDSFTVASLLPGDALAQGDRPLLPSDLFFKMVLAGHTVSSLGYTATPAGLSKKDLAEWKENDALRRRNAPTQIVIGGGPVIDLEKELQGLKGHRFTADELRDMTRRFGNLLSTGAGHDDFPLPAPDKARYLNAWQSGHEDDAASPLASVAQRITDGTMHANNSAYGLALAIAYWHAEKTGKLGPYREHPLAPALPSASADDAVYIPTSLPTPESGSYEVIPASRFHRELLGLIQELQAQGWGNKYHKDGSHVLPVDKDGKLSFHGLEDLLAKDGIIRPEQLGNHDQDITLAEFEDYARSHLQKPGDFTKPTKGKAG